MIRDLPPIERLIQEDLAEELLLSTTNSSRQVVGVLGNWANLTCHAFPMSSLEEKHLRFEWSFQNETLVEAYGVHMRAHGNVSTLQVLILI